MVGASWGLHPRPQTVSSLLEDRFEVGLKIRGSWNHFFPLGQRTIIRVCLFLRQSFRLVLKGHQMENQPFGGPLKKTHPCSIPRNSFVTHSTCPDSKPPIRFSEVRHPTPAPHPRPPRGKGAGKTRRYTFGLIEQTSVSIGASIVPNKLDSRRSRIGDGFDSEV